MFIQAACTVTNFIELHLEKHIMAQLVNKLPPFIQPQNSLLFLQEVIIGSLMQLNPIHTHTFPFDFFMNVSSDAAN
jgi:hypothetical protein